MISYNKDLLNIYHSQVLFGAMGGDIDHEAKIYY